jgi:hypothetical protein
MAKTLEIGLKEAVGGAARGRWVEFERQVGGATTVVGVQ